MQTTIADFPEQCWNASISGSYCPVCVVPCDACGDLNQDMPLRERKPTLSAISEQCKGGSPNFVDWGLRDQWPWWNRHAYINIVTMHTPDLLHQCHKGVFKDHLAKYIQNILGTKEMDECYMLMPRHHRIHHFKRGISKISRLTSRKAKEMMKVFLPVAGDASPDVVKATRALLKFMYLTHSSTLTEEELCEMDKQLSIFHEHKSAPEQLHIDLTKAGFNASNKIDDTELEQMAEYIQHMDSLALHRAYLNYVDQPEAEDEDDDWRDGWEDHDNFDDEDLENFLDSDNMEDGELGDGSASSCHLDCDSDRYSEEEDEDEDLSGGCVVEKVRDMRQDAADSQGCSHDQDAAVSPNQWEPPVHYPNPEIVTAKSRNKTVTVEYLVKVHSATNLINDV
ncbi:hypothetical protein FRC11_003504, partial [Ceratobasidium sp. 423]